MNVLVCIKQVPAKSVPMDKTNGVLDRSKAGGRMNPWDFYAVEAGLRIAESTGGSVTSLSMGPESAKSVLKESLSMGVKEAFLLCDRAFAGADVFATAYTLSQGIKAIGNFDVIICGQQTTDGDTAQLPYSLASQLGIPAIGWVKAVGDIEGEKITALEELSFGTQQVKVQTPCLLAVGDGIGRVRIPTLRDQLKSKKKEINVLTLDDLQNKDPLSYGLKASPTRVVKIHETQHTQKHEPSVLSAVDAAKAIIKDINCINGGIEE